MIKKPFVNVEKNVTYDIFNLHANAYWLPSIPKYKITVTTNENFAVIITDCIARSATRRYLSYSEAHFEFFFATQELELESTLI